MLTVRLEKEEEADQPEDGRWSIHTDVFDGPLDLLLYLVRRDGIDLKRLSLAQIANSYLEYLDRMRELNLTIAADYLVMAATLVHLKSMDLLPRPPRIVEEDGIDPREELARRLVEYEKLKIAAGMLGERPRVGRDHFVREPLPSDAARREVVAGIDAFGLLDMYWEILRKADAPEPKVMLVAPGPDLMGCCKRLMAATGGQGGRIELTALLKQIESRVERVATFLAALEMGRLQWMLITQEQHLAPIIVEQLKRNEDIDLTIIAGLEVDAAEEEDAALRAELEQLSLPLVAEAERRAKQVEPPTPALEGETDGE